ncbi:MULTISPECIES: dihydrodipicolinate synthase family protein [Agrobacterium]|jgi:4-hydroxy-tetrahydrodipicolinate synthase|uniref:4-hydroxy-tetrahydrodipicolinate synthase n=1 Tax=Agrobacterium radiobacter TaxID=362 RepID=A0ABR6JDR1_AGRRD|nr:MULTISPECIES: dihydrodipicolinate synthase family protein [Agrobacterium tumefaciens complex]MCP2136004.1 4-hydroxy-tetrahydrodipicolinate synthase [Rhizobium sp. SLBN-94]TGE78388.1 dihydrodipicolinate synthase family protein [Rhizobium sp. SEMIA 439]EPR20031.1 dihydrodipicolinate synthase [Agrobacterium radiobacter DSM 30147]KAA1232802.1 dihydrodipicolinate synthase family protein [Agrobacterium tumefaciens]KAB0458171.1 dihydrodipicolinate synthase family protein [Agrobacterium tumefaciens
MTTFDFRQALHGISGVPVTAYEAGGEVDIGVTTEVYARVARAGIHNIVAAGNTGEFYALTPAEILRVYEAAIKGVDGKAPVTAAIGRSQREALAMARQAREMGASAVMSHQPVDPFAAPQSQIDYFIGLADGSELPLVAYVRADGFSVDDMVRLASHPNVAGIKFATTDIMLLSRAIAASDQKGALYVCGLAESWAPAFSAVGARGFTSGLVNVAPQFSLEVHEALTSGDFSAARKVVEKIELFERLRTRYRNGANVTVVKEAMEILGLKVGPVRAPGLARLDEQDRKTLEGLLASWR